VWSEEYPNKAGVDWFLSVCENAHNRGEIVLSQDEVREDLEQGAYGVTFFYRSPLGYRFGSLFQDGEGYVVFFVNNADICVSKKVESIDEALEMIQKVEAGEI
jgi:hypothetical protein